MTGVEKERQVLIHVGLPKAGSTYLQKCILEDSHNLVYVNDYPKSSLYRLCEVIVNGHPAEVSEIDG